LELPNLLMLRVDNRQQTHDQRSSFGIRDGWNLDPHAFRNRKARPDHLRLVPRVIEKLQIFKVKWSMVNGQWSMVNGQWSMVKRFCDRGPTSGQGNCIAGG
jgi:hypothetical protein